MGERVSSEILVGAPPLVVHGVITDLDAYPEWASGVTSVEVLERDEQGRPATATFTVDAKVVDVAWTCRYHYEGNDIRWNLTEGTVVSQLDGAYTLREDGEGTHVTYELEVDIDIPLPGFLKKRAARQILDTGLRGLKERAESHA